MKIRLLGLALVPLLAAPPVFAQEAVSAATDTDGTPHGVATNSTTGGDADAAFKRWAVVGSATLMQPSSRPLRGTSVDVDGDTAPTISASYYATPNIAVELWGAADKFKHDVSDSAGRIGSVDQLPLAISGQYHFGTPDKVFRPFVGVGYYQSNFSNENLGSVSGEHVGVKDAKGAIGTVGLDMNINPNWFARVDARYMDGSPDLTVNGSRTGEDLDLNPWTVGVGIGARF
ncbi:OmpW family outer membrane protein [Pseudoxanthomonas sp.]|uniref:OmpW/AlkL family protein n=1 Tax=Pseudoxanthomonas sp. TaxID=1871049 RepID=UPI00262CCAD4|nr:OmpW family outer membrane protein [Pseudoxanthomonas sp.]WDS34624.1 MAG: outer membrane beta-barrel protein [Pseudoxanthomonas sp.]